MSTTPIGSPAHDASSEREMPTPQSKDKGKVPATSSSEHLTNTVLFDDDSDGELSDDPAPYAGRTLINKELTSMETFAPHDTDPTKIEATFRIKMPDGSGWFTQKDVIPEKRDSADEDLYEPGATIFFPDLDSRKVPKKDKEKKSDVVVRWKKVADYRWERTFKGKHEVFTPSIALRRFNARSHAYEHIHIGSSKLNNINPNNKTWKDAYNKWIDQISRRSNADYQKKKTRDHWTVGELCAMYTAINAFVHANGVDAYDSISTSDLSAITDTINAVGGKGRGLDALRGQITSAHETKNNTMWYLRENARDFRLFIEGGGVASHDERYPTHIIPLTEFPVEKRTNHRKGMRKSRMGTYKSKFRSVGTQTGDDNVIHDDSDGGAGNQASTGPVSKKRKRGAPASDSDEEADISGEDSEEEEVEHGYSSEASETSDNGDNEDEAEDLEADSHPQPKKLRLTENAIELARQLLEED